MVKGTVTISTEDYHKFLDSTSKSLEIRKDLELAVKELQVFLSFLCTREKIDEYVAEFNRIKNMIDVLLVVILIIGVAVVIAKEIIFENGE